jgi:hypothetical protein
MNSDHRTEATDDNRVDAGWRSTSPVPAGDELVFTAHEEIRPIPGPAEVAKLGPEKQKTPPERGCGRGGRWWTRTTDLFLIREAL